MRFLLWSLLALAGFGLMCHGYYKRAPRDGSLPWSSGMIVVERKSPAAEPPVGKGVRGKLRLLPGNERTEAILAALGTSAQFDGRTLAENLRPKLIALSLADDGVNRKVLASGRFPDAPGEAVAGTDLADRETVKVGDASVKIVGRLRPDVALFHDALLVNPEGNEALFPDKDESVRQVMLIRLDHGESPDREVRMKLIATYPVATFGRIVPEARLERPDYYRYLLGQGLFLLAGSGALLALFRAWANRLDAGETVSEEPAAPTPRRSWLALPLTELRDRPGLVWLVHVAYFGLVLAGASLIYELPEVQAVLMSSVTAQIEGKSPGPLAVAGSAYRSGNIPYAALVTFVVNFFLGSLACITIPSMIVPALGTLIAALRACLWGVLLAPTSLILAASMIPHSLTMLLEGEGYILSTIFGLLMLVGLFDPRWGDTIGRRFLRGWKLNALGALLVAVVLTVAACYEATEVIIMSRG